MTDEDKRMEALTRLALATREKVDRASYVLYLEDTARFSTAVIVDACRRLETSSPWFPKLAELIEECRIVAQQHAERAEAERRKRLPPPPPRPEFLADVMAKIRALGRTKGMK